MTVASAGKGVEFTVLAFEFYAVEEFLEHVDAFGVAYQEDVISQVVTSHIYMVEAPIGSQYQFA